MFYAKQIKSHVNVPLLSAALLVFFGSFQSVVFSENVRQSNSEPVGLLVLTHGSPSPQWMESVGRLTERLNSLNKKTATFKAIEAANLEFCQPDASCAIYKLETAGCRRIVVVPAFIFPTSHSHFDVPAVLGLYSSPSIRETLAKENATVARPTVPITMTQTLSEGNLLEKYVSDEVAALSTKPAGEVLILIAHGDEGHEGLIDPTMKELTTKACGRFGLAQGDWAYCEVGQSYSETVRPLIRKYSSEGKRVLVVGLYLATSAEKINAIAQKMTSNTQPIIDERDEGNSADVVFSKNGVIDHPSCAEFILNIAESAL